MLLRGMLSDEELEILVSSKIYRYGKEDSVRVHSGYELGVIAREYATDYDAIAKLVGELNLNSTEGRRESSLRISEEVNGILNEISIKCNISKIAAVRAVLQLRRLQMQASRTSVRIMTWNTSLYRSSADTPNYVEIVKTIKNFLNGSEISLAVLQEIPYYCKDKELGWIIHPLFLRLEEDFPKEQYCFHYNISSQKQIMMTVMLSKKGAFSATRHLPIENNRIVSCECGALTIIGVHMPTDFATRKSDNQETLEVKQFKRNVWIDLIKCVREFNHTDHHLLIAGDFNAYIGCAEKETEELFIELCRQAKDIVPDDSPTFVSNTPIDHVFINFDAKSQYSVYIEKCFSLSDHKRIEVALF